MASRRKASVGTVVIAGPVISRLWEHNAIVHTVVVNSHTSLLLLSCYGKALRLQPLWARSQPAATTPIHNRRMEGSPKLKALLSLRLVATQRWSDRLISLWHLGRPWLWPLVCTPSRHTIHSCSLGPSGTRACQQEHKHKACTKSRYQDKQISTFCLWFL